MTPNFDHFTDPYGVIMADPPWRFKCRTDEITSRSIERHYPTMALKDILALPIRDIGARDCHLFMWVTDPFLEHAFEVGRAWGFKYSSVAFVWIKLRRARTDEVGTRPMWMVDADFAHNHGYTTLKGAEQCLLFRRGSPKRHAVVRQLIIDWRRENSRKPDLARRRIESYGGPVPRLELFSRQRFEGWGSWGNQPDHFSAPGTPGLESENHEYLRSGAHSGCDIPWNDARPEAVDAAS